MPKSSTLGPSPAADQADTSPRADGMGHPRLLHVTCPQGHKLDAPCVLDGQAVVCPFCGDRFLFSYERSEEYRRDRPLPPRQRRLRRLAWLGCIVLAVTVTVVGVVALQWFVQPR